MLELERRGNEIAYVRTPGGLEVDFLAIGSTGEQSLIQVCAELDDAETLNREVRALEAALFLYPQAVPYLVTLNPEGVVTNLPAFIKVVTAAGWLLD